MCPLPHAPLLQVLYDKWVDTLGQAAENLEWEPAEVGVGQPLVQPGRHGKAAGGRAFRQPGI